MPPHEHQPVGRGQTGQGMVTAAPADEIGEVIEELPLDRQHPVEGPEIEVLPAMPPVVGLMGRQPTDQPEVDVVIVAGEVGEGVVQAVVLVGPDQGTAAQQIERHGGSLVDPAVAGIGTVATVVLDVEADGGDRQAEAGREGQRSRPAPDLEDKQKIGEREPGQDHRRFDHHGQGIAPVLARALEVLVNPCP